MPRTAHRRSAEVMGRLRRACLMSPRAGRVQRPHMAPLCIKTPLQRGPVSGGSGCSWRPRTLLQHGQAERLNRSTWTFMSRTGGWRTNRQSGLGARLLQAGDMEATKGITCTPTQPVTPSASAGATITRGASSFRPRAARMGDRPPTSVLADAWQIHPRSSPSPPSVGSTTRRGFFPAYRPARRHLPAPQPPASGPTNMRMWPVQQEQRSHATAPTFACSRAHEHANVARGGDERSSLRSSDIRMFQRAAAPATAAGSPGRRRTSGRSPTRRRCRRAA